MTIKESIESNLEDPEALEKLYRQSPEQFTRTFDEVFHAHPSSTVLEVWQARLQFDKPMRQRQGSSFLHRPSEIMLIILLALVSGTLAKLPHFFGGIDEEMFYPRNLGFFVLPALACYFLFKNTVERSTVIGLGLAMGGAALFINAMQVDLDQSDTMVLACIHLPFFLWALVGIAFAGNNYRELAPRMDYLKFNGEMVIYTILTLIGGGLLTGITLGLFNVIGLRIEEWYFKNVVIYGAVAAPLVATYVAIQRVDSGQRLAPTFAKIFSPLVLITLTIFLIANGIQGKSPFTDRDFLIVFNAMLMGVLAITVFTISERPTSDTRIVSDYIAIALVMVALIVDLIALSAIVFRLASYGLTPNRLAVLGANLLVFGNLAGILYYYAGFLRGKMDMQVVENWITRYLPLYAVWTIFIVFAMPFLFRLA